MHVFELRRGDGGSHRGVAAQATRNSQGLNARHGEHDNEDQVTRVPVHECRFRWVLKQGHDDIGQRSRKVREEKIDSRVPSMMQLLQASLSGARSHLHLLFLH